MFNTQYTVNICCLLDVLIKSTMLGGVGGGAGFNIHPLGHTNHMTDPFTLT